MWDWNVFLLFKIDPTASQEEEEAAAAMMLNVETLCVPFTKGHLAYALVLPIQTSLPRKN